MKKNASRYSFFESVYRVARKIPRGKVTTYGHIARFLGTGKSARLVGWALNASFSADPPVPAHRVVNHQGLLTGKHHFPTPHMMKDLLQSEGVEVDENDRIVNFKSHLWIPEENLSSGI